jgi:arylsulfatase A-like enzyme
MLFETCDRVPLIIRVPRSVKSGQTAPGSTSEGLVELVDLFPTLAELCAIDAPDNLQGQSLVPMLRNPGLAGKQVAYTVVTRGPKLGKAIRTARWRYTSWPGGEELYDLKNDPEEESNLANSQQLSDTLRIMRAHLADIESRARSEKR